MPTGEKEYATICRPCGRGDEVGDSRVNGVAGRRVEQGKAGRGVDQGKAGRRETGRTGESCVSKVEALCSKAGVAARVLGACSRPAAFCAGSRGSRGRRRRSTKEKHFVGGRAWPEKEEGLRWKSSLPGRRGRRLGSGLRRRKGGRKEEGSRVRKGGRREGVMECNCKRVEVGEVLEERQVLLHFYSHTSFFQITCLGGKFFDAFCAGEKKDLRRGGSGGRGLRWQWGGGGKIKEIFLILSSDLQDFDVAIEKKSGRSGLW